MSSSGYEVKITALEDAEVTYKAQASAVTEYRNRFQSAATLRPSAFGRLRASEEAAAQYDAFLKKVVADMDTLSGALTNGGTTLGVNAAAYRRVEDANIIAI